MALSKNAARRSPVRRLRHISSDELTIQRVRHGRGFGYRDADGRRITDEETLARIRSLAIPPAYECVRIAADPAAHLQAVGYDQAGRIQHRYHPDWEEVRERRKRTRLARLIATLSKLRARVAKDLRARTLGPSKALACAVAIIDRSHIRVGNDIYANAHGSYGASTLLKRHVAIAGRTVTLHFRGKSGKDIACEIEDAALARALDRIAALPGRHLLQYRREDGGIARIRAAEINAYLRSICDQRISSKDIRMLAANVAAAELLLAGEDVSSETGRKRRLADIMRVISERLVNTPAVVRKSYVHAIVIDAYASGQLQRIYKKMRSTAHCSRIERALGRLAARSTGPKSEARFSEKADANQRARASD